MSHIVIGKHGAKNVSFDLDTLIRTRLLIQANSGKGKSWLLRRLAEQLFGKVQVIIIDPEGEFASLREKFGFVLVGKGGETPADPRSAALVARKLLELRPSALADIYELKPSQRHAWVRAFLDAMIDAPKNLWHPVVVILDEAHVFCPEKGAGESEASESVINLATRGRKRGYCLIAATQRLGKFRKDAAAEMLNVMIGGTFIDIDRKRAADALGVYGKDVHGFFDEIKLLERGHFYALGPAVSPERLMTVIGPIETSHPEAGSAKHAAEAPPAPAAIAKLLPKLSDLPKEAEEKAKTEAELRREIRELKAQVRSAGQQKVQPPAAKAAAADPRAIERAVRQVESKYAPIRAALEEAMKIFVKVNAMGFEGTELKADEIEKALKATATAIGKVAQSKMEARSAEFERLKKETQRVLLKLQRALDQDIKVDLTVKHNEPVTVAAVREPTALRPRTAMVDDGSELTPYMCDILRGLAELAAIGRSEVPWGLAGAAAGKSHKSSTFERYAAALRKMGLIEYVGGKMTLTEAGQQRVTGVDGSFSSADLHQRLLKILTPYQREIVTALIEAGGEVMSWDEVGEKIGKSAGSSTFERYMSQLRSAEIIEYAGTKTAKAADWLFLE